MNSIPNNPTVSDSSTEEWRDIPGYEGLYQASNLGRIKVLVSRKSVKAGHILGGYQANGYHYVRLSKNKVKTAYSLHRIILSTFRPISNSQDLDVNHLDGDKSNNRPENLDWCTHQENMAHSRNVLKAWPERSKLMLNPKNFLTMTEDVQRLKQFLLKKSRVTHTELCIYMGIDDTTSRGHSRLTLLMKCAKVTSTHDGVYTYSPSFNEISFARTVLISSNEL